MNSTHFPDLNSLALDFQSKLIAQNAKQFILLYAYNGTGKTRLSAAFKDIGKQAGSADTLYFNAYTEDLFSWDNDLDGDTERYLILHPSSNFLAGLVGVDMDTKVYDILKLYADFEFYLDEIPVNDENGRFIRNERIVRFSRDVRTAGGTTKVENIKISRSEENLFIWCFYLAVLQMVMDGDVNYDWVKYIYIDDPISSLDENNAVAVANHLAQMLTKPGKKVPAVISSHHVLFFNVLCNELGKSHKFLVRNDETSGGYLVSDTSSKPFLHHLASLVQLHEVRLSGDVKRHHFNMMRCIMEQTAIFLGLGGWTECIKVPDSDPEKALHERMINVMSHADYLINEPDVVNTRHKDDFRRIVEKFINSHPFNRALFPIPAAPAPAAPAAPAAPPAPTA